MKSRLALLPLLALGISFLVAPAPAQADPTACPTATVTVSTEAALEAALTGAQPGDVIQIADGTYNGGNAVANQWTATHSGTAASPIWLCGGPNAVLTNDGITSSYGLHLNGASYWHLLGFSVTAAQKGVIVDSASHVTVEGLNVHGVGDEGVHLRKNTTYSTVTGNTIHDTGNRREKFGEGVYVGSADSNWGALTGGQPDHSDNNVVSYNTIYDTPAESVDLKEGTQNGEVYGNNFDGSGQTSEGGDSWVDAKGNAWKIYNNVGHHSSGDGFQTHHKNLTNSGLGNWGLSNKFKGNTVDVQGPGYGFFIHDPSTTGNQVDCDNVITGAASGSYSYGVTCTTVTL